MVKTFRLRNKKLLAHSAHGLLFVPVLLATEALAQGAVRCEASATGEWLCASRGSAAKRPARPDHQQAAIISPDTLAVDVTAKASSATHTPSKQSLEASELDWVPRGQLSTAQLAEIGPYCSGTYIEPVRPGAQDATPLSDAPLFVSANASRYAQKEQTSTLAGNVVLRQANIQAEADTATLYQAENKGELKGNVRLRNQGMLVTGDQAEIQLDNGAAQINNAQYVVHEARARGKAQHIKRDAEGIIRLKDGSYTTCPPGSNTWQVKSNNVTLNPATGVGTATNATLRMQDIPVFYMPYMQFPIDERRQSGFLAPSVGYSNDDGMTLSTPYYFNLAPNYDATLYPRIMSNRGALLQGEGRYLTRSSEGTISGAYLDDQDDENKDQPKYEKTRYLAGWQHTQGLDQRLLGQIDYTTISDPYYFQDLGTDLDVSSKTYVNQQGQMTWRGDSFTARLNAQAYQLASVTDITPYNRLPQLNIEGTLPFNPGGLELGYAGEYVRFERSLDEYVFNGEDSPDISLTGINRANGTRAHVAPGISLPMQSSWAYITPSAKYLYTKYDLDLDQQGQADLAAAGESYQSSQNRSLGLYSLDSGLYFDRDTSLFGTKLRQTLEPRFYYLYVPYKDQENLPIFDTNEPAFTYASLFRENRFSGTDRIGDTNQLSVGTSSRFIEENGFERAQLGIGQAFYFADRKVQMPGLDPEDAPISPTALFGEYRMNQDWRVHSDYAYDADAGQTNSGSVMLHYQPESTPNKIINLGYRYRNDAIVFNQDTNQYEQGTDDYKVDQSDVSIMWPLIPQWSTIGRWQFDYSKHSTLEAFGGFEYDSCCWKVRLVSRYWIEPDDVNLSTRDRSDHGIFFQIVLKGLGGITGNKVDSFLDQGIQGYRERENQSR